MEKHKTGMQKAEVFMHKPEGEKMFLKEKQTKKKSNDDFELPILDTTAYLYLLSFLPFSTWNIVLLCSQSWFETCSKKRL